MAISVTNAIVSLDPFRRLEGTLVFSGTLNTELSAQGLEGSVLVAGTEERTGGGEETQLNGPLRALTSPPRACLGLNQEQSTALGARGRTNLIAHLCAATVEYLDWIVYKDQEFGTPGLLFDFLAHRGRSKQPPAATDGS